MAIIATLKPAESGTAADAHSIASIPLSKLVAWDGNVRKTGAGDGLEELTASIAAHGVLQSLVVRKTQRGKFAILAGRRRFLALSALAEAGTIAPDAPVPCRVVPGSADGAEISLAENVVRAPMHPADQFEAFRDLIDAGATPEDIAARFGITEAAVKKRLRLARVSPVVFEAYRKGDLTLEQVQAFAVSDDAEAQERVFGELPQDSDPRDIRHALTEHDIAATDRRARFVTVAAYEEAGGALRRDLFAEGDEGVFLLDSVLLDRLAREKLEAAAEAVRAEGWKWVETEPELDYEARAAYRRRPPEPLPLSGEAAAERKRLAEEYHTLFDGMEEGDEEASARLDAIESRIAELEDTGSAYTPETLAIAGAIVTIGRDGAAEVHRGLVRSEDAIEEEASGDPASPRVKPLFSASLIESLTEAKSAALGASLMERPGIALAALTHVLAAAAFLRHGEESSLEIAPKRVSLRGESKGLEALEEAHAKWSERLPSESGALWPWCLAQDQATLLELLAYCLGRSINAVQAKHERPDDARLRHAGALATALGLDMTQWFTPTAANYFARVGRAEIATAITDATGRPAKRSWEKLKKAELAALAEREVAGKGWLPQPLRA
jgi:ParB family chromosome partitioning protein